MNICLFGDGLTALTLAKALINKNFKVFMYYEESRNLPIQNRTIGVSSNNLDFLQKNIIKINKNLFWNIYDIEIYSDKEIKKKILNFKSQNNKLFCILKNSDLIKLLNKSLSKSKNFKKFKINKNYPHSKIFPNRKFQLFINCDGNNEISNKYFYKKFLKNYESTAYASTINHNKIDNRKAIQIFTKYGPLAFLPISESQTSLVYSIKNKSITNFNKLSEKQFEKLILKNNKNYKIKSFNKLETFKLNSKILRNYYYNNILAFGDMLHQIHPLSGQGFNMTLRDIKILLNLIKQKQSLGLQIDESIFQEFENKTKHLNFLFASGNDFIYEFFNYNNNLNFPSKKILSYFNNNKLFKNLAIKYADQGLII